MNIEEHLEALQKAKAAVGGRLETPPRKAPFLAIDLGPFDGKLTWDERCGRYIAEAPDLEKPLIFRTAEELLRHCRTSRVAEVNW
jgi:hypothetical protein